MFSFLKQILYKHHPRKSGEPGSMSPVTGKNAGRPEKRRFESNKLESSVRSARLLDLLDPSSDV